MHEGEVGVHPLQAGVLRLELLDPLELADGEAAVLRLPIVERGIADAEFSAELAGLLAALVAGEDGDDLGLAESGLLHGSESRAETLLSSGRRTGEPTIHADQSIRGSDVTEVVARICAQRGQTPARIQVDNGSEFISQALDRWAYDRGVTLDFSRPGKPTDNPYIESFNGSFRDECLNVHWFLSLDDARAKIEAWRKDYNSYRPHRSLADLPPDLFTENYYAETADSPLLTG